MRILENEIYRDMTEEELAKLEHVANEEPIQKDGLISLAEGLSTAKSLAQVRNSAKIVLGDA